MVCENVKDKCRRKGPKVVLAVPSVELRARLGSSHVLGVALGLLMTGQIALVMETKIAGPAFERITGFIPFS